MSADLSPLGNPAKIVQAVRAGRFVLVTSPKLLAELEDVLGRPRIAARLDADALERVREVTAAAPLGEDPPVVAVSRDPKDDYLIVLAQRSRSACLVSGDKDLSVLAGLVPPILTPAAFLAELETW